MTSPADPSQSVTEKKAQPEPAAVPLIVSVSGIRGTVGESLTPQVALDFAACYGTPLRGRKVVVSRDGRHTGPMLHGAVVAGLLAVGCEVVDIGIAATPTCGFYVRHVGAGGGIQITASHNPLPYNGMKLYRPEGFVLSPAAGREIKARYESRQFEWVAATNVPGRTVVEDAFAPHLERVLSLVDVAAIRKRTFRVVVDANHGSGATFAARLLRELGCTVTVLGDVADGRFEHPPEPTAANLVGLCEAVKEHGADVGFAVDPDADRCAIVDDGGRYIGEEYTLALCVEHRLTQTKGPVVINGSTSKISEDAAKAAGCECVRTPVGEVNVAEEMIATGAVIGGEGNGGVIDPRVGYGRDSAISMALILEMLAGDDRPLSRRVPAEPAYHIRKETVPLDRDRLDAALAGVRKRFADAEIDDRDGLRCDLGDAWVQVRASNTEPIVRVIAEAATERKAAELCAAAERAMA